MELDTGKDGIHAENNDDTSLGFVYISNGTFDVEAEGDGISAEPISRLRTDRSGFLQAEAAKTVPVSPQIPGEISGAAEVSTETTEENSTEASEDSSTSMKGMKASGNLLITDGSFTIDSADDAVHSNTSLTVNEGNVYRRFRR